MAEKKEAQAINEERLDNTEKEQKKTIKAVKQEKYQKNEFIKAAETLFGVKPECVTAAFFDAKKEEATEEEAKKMILDFMRKEVR